MKIEGKLIFGWCNYNKQKQRRIYRLWLLALDSLMVMQLLYVIISWIQKLLYSQIPKHLTNLPSSLPSRPEKEEACVCLERIVSFWQCIREKDHLSSNKTSVLQISAKNVWRVHLEVATYFDPFSVFLDRLDLGDNLVILCFQDSTGRSPKKPSIWIRKPKKVCYQ